MRTVDTSPATLLRLMTDICFTPEVREIAPGVYSVQSKSDHSLYHRVNLNAAQPTCSHEFFKRGQVCSHINLAIDARDAAREDAAYAAFQAHEAPLSDPDFDDVRALVDDGPVDFDSEGFEGAEFEPFKPGDQVVYTNPRDGWQVRGTVQSIDGERACVKCLNGRAAYDIANLTPAPVPAYARPAAERSEIKRQGAAAMAELFAA